MLKLTHEFEGNFSMDGLRTQFHYTAADNRDSLEPQECICCGNVVDYWYDDDNGGTYCDECVELHPDGTA